MATIVILGGICLFVYLSITAWIDYLTMRVYRRMNRVFGLIGAILVLNIHRETIREVTGYLIFMAVLYCLLISLKCMGAGDGKVLWVTAIYQVLLFGVRKAGVIHIQVYFITIVALLVINRSSFEWKKLRFQKPVPMVPSILVGNTIGFILNF